MGSFSEPLLANICFTQLSSPFCLIVVVFPNYLNLERLSDIFYRVTINYNVIWVQYIHNSGYMHVYIYRLPLRKCSNVN